MLVNVRARLCSHPTSLHERIRRSKMHLLSPLSHSRSSSGMCGEEEWCLMSEKGVVTEGDNW